MLFGLQNNQFIMPDLSFRLRGNTRRMYLIRKNRDNNQLYWVGVVKAVQTNVIQVTVIKIVHPDTIAQSLIMDPGMIFHVETMDEGGNFQQRGQTCHVCWDRTVLNRSANAMKHGVARHLCMSTLFSPPWCTATVYNGQQYNAIITWSSVYS